VFDLPRLSLVYVPYVTFPLAGRRGTTVLDRSTAYLVFGERAGRLAGRLARAREIDVVYGLGASALGYARIHRRDPGGTVPFVLNPQGLEEFGATDPRRAPLKRLGYLPLRAAVRACGRAADRVIATDRSLEPVVRLHLDVPPDRIAVVPNAVDLDACDRLAGPLDGARLRARHGIAAAERLLLSAGRIEENKGFQVLVEALARLARDETMPWRWVLVGEGPFRPRLERAIAAHGLEPKVLLAGRVPDAELHAWYEAATLFVHPTLYEGSSLVTLEAMAHRLPVVASNAGGLADKVRPGVNGWLVTPGDRDALATAIRSALAAEHPSELGARGRALAEREFSWPVVADRWLGLCAELMKERRGPARET
jgi:glycosyltransferase involved in cell wall biosynthesis